VFLFSLLALANANLRRRNEARLIVISLPPIKAKETMAQPMASEALAHFQETPEGFVDWWLASYGADPAGSVNIVKELLQAHTCSDNSRRLIRQLLNHLLMHGRGTFLLYVSPLKREPTYFKTKTIKYYRFRTTPSYENWTWGGNTLNHFWRMYRKNKKKSSLLDYGFTQPDLA